MKSELIKIEEFYSESLQNNRSLYIYLPPSYKFNINKHYPVLYMQDGQNIFDGSESYSGKGWEINSTADSLINKKDIEEIIIVGIAHQNEERMSEYAHTDGCLGDSCYEGTGNFYETFLISEVMPFIESNYRVNKGPEHTALMGSSMGGLVTFNIGLNHPEIFGKLGIVSPSFWWNTDILVEKINNLNIDDFNTRIWIDIGDAEGDFSEGFTEVMDAFWNKGIVPIEQLACLIVPFGIHSELDWMERVHCPLLYLFGNIGNPIELQFHGRNIMSVSEQNLNTKVILSYDTGFMHTPQDIIYKYSDPGVLKINKNGEIQPIAIGKTVVQAFYLNLSAYQEYTLINDLSPMVTLKLNVFVPDDNLESIFIGTFEPDEYELKKEDNYYTVTLELPRDYLLHFKFTLGTWDEVEKDQYGYDITSRRLIASKDETIELVVEKW